MPVTVNYPGVYIEELPSSVRTIVGVPTSVTAFVGAGAAWAYERTPPHQQLDRV